MELVFCLNVDGSIAGRAYKGGGGGGLISGSLRYYQPTEKTSISRMSIER